MIQRTPRFRGYDDVRSRFAAARYNNGEVFIWLHSTPVIKTVLKAVLPEPQPENYGKPISGFTSCHKSEIF